ncbi:flagellar export chaperone FliS [Uliginosibacterium paludis]|uniref:Flagellar secretion chaperone FliS n=1 Tax=Uliginosibacterium paludis TaxID=1615952 RepID=A0ABV2CK34_9RHOO
MFARQSAAAYARVGIETNVASANPHQLVLMLFDGALLSINTAAAAIEENDMSGKIRHVTKAIEIISMGLKASLDQNAGGELADRLGALYDYMCLRLTLANAQNSTAPLTEVAGLLRELRDAWAQISDAGLNEARLQEA